MGTSQPPSSCSSPRESSSVRADTTVDDGLQDFIYSSLRNYGSNLYIYIGLRNYGSNIYIYTYKVMQDVYHHKYDALFLRGFNAVWLG